MAFKHQISFATDLAANFGCNQFRITPAIVSKLLSIAILSRCAVTAVKKQQRIMPWRCFCDLSAKFPQMLGAYEPSISFQVREDIGGKKSP